MLTIVTNVHTINPNYIFNKYLNGTEPKNKSLRQQKGGKSPILLSSFVLKE